MNMAAQRLTSETLICTIMSISDDLFVLAKAETSSLEVSAFF